jgi:6-pyruvoyltetrahydropterin/6-carboxytetrahydropterin synthase
MFELSQSFYFESAHTLRREVERNEADGSRRVHGHTYTAEVSVRGRADPSTGMVVDLAVLREAIARVREQLDHHFLDEVPGLDVPTLENLCVFIHERVAARVPGVASVSVARHSSGDRCVYLGPAGAHRGVASQGGDGGASSGGHDAGHGGDGGNGGNGGE